MQKRNDIASGSTITLAAVFYLVNSKTIKIFQGPGATIINSRTVPMIWGAVLLLLGLVLLLKGMFGYDKRKSIASTISENDISTQQLSKHGLIKILLNNIEVIGTGALLGGYVLILKNVGFILATAGYLFLQILLLGYGKRKKILIHASIIAIFISLGVYLLFVYLLNIRLPSGVVPF